MERASVNPLISVVVPVYKVEPYLKKCVDSITNQTYTNLEIILVDDGSPDNCPAICDELAKQDGRIKVIHQKNSGGSNARNAGMDIAQGEYISFVDSDDWIDVQLYEKVMCHAPFSVMSFGVMQVWENSDTVCIKKNPNYRYGFDEQSNRELLYEAMKTDVFGYACNKVYRLDIIKDMKFRYLSGRDDLRFNIDVLAQVKSFDSIDFNGYYYLQREGSMLRCHDNTRAFLPFLEYMNSISGKFPEDVYSVIYNMIVKQYLIDRIYWDIIINTKPTLKEKKEELKFVFSQDSVRKRLYSEKNDTKLTKLFVLCYKLNKPMLFYKTYVAMFGEKQNG